MQRFEGKKFLAHRGFALDAVHDPVFRGGSDAIRRGVSRPGGFM